MHHCHCTRQTNAKGVKRISVFELQIILSLTSANSSSVTDPEKELSKSKFSIVHYNLQSLANRVKLIKGE